MAAEIISGMSMIKPCIGSYMDTSRVASEFLKF
jgi:hypothetical protein